jgi:hypothetical protein
MKCDRHARPAKGMNAAQFMIRPYVDDNARKPIVKRPKMSRFFEELDYQPTAIGPISLRRRRELRLDVDVLEICLVTSI